MGAGEDVVGGVGIVYDHEVGHADDEIMDIQHRHLEVIAPSLHVHLDAENCLLIIAVRRSSRLELSRHMSMFRAGSAHSDLSIGSEVA